MNRPWNKWTKQEYDNIFRNIEYKKKPSENIVAIIVVIGVILIVGIFIAGCSFNKEENKEGGIATTTPDYTLYLEQLSDQEIKDEYEKRFGEGILESDVCSMLPYNGDGELQLSFDCKDAWYDFTLKEEEQICIQEKYEQIKDTLKSKAGDVFKWYQLEELYIEECKSSMRVSCLSTTYTKEEIQDKLFFKPIN